MSLKFYLIFIYCFTLALYSYSDVFYNNDKARTEAILRKGNEFIDSSLKDNIIFSELEIAEDDKIVYNSDIIEKEFEKKSGFFLAGKNLKSLLQETSINNISCANLSSFPCTDVVVKLPYNLNFTGAEGKLKDKTNSSGIGFTMALPPSSPLSPPTDPNFPGYEPSLLEIASGRLRITTTAGIMSLNPSASTNTNSQVNALGVGVQAHNRLITIETTLINPPAGSNNFEQGGLYFGLDEDNYVKLVVVATSSGRAIIELLREIKAASVNTVDNVRSSAMTLSSSTVRLKLIINPENNTAEAFYKVNTGAEIRLGVLSIPANFINGITLGTQSNVSYAGMFATHRRATSSLVYVFDDFNITTPLTAPAAPSGLTSTAINSSEIALNWKNNADNAKNIIIESTTDLNSSFKILATLEPNVTNYTHSGLIAAQTYYYRVSASNEAGSSGFSNTGNAMTPSLPGGSSCANISPFSCSEVITSLPYSLNFTGAEGGVKDRTNSSCIGFTMALPHTASLTPPTNPDIPGYEPSLLEIASGRLRITTTAGIKSLSPSASTNTNSQVNALGVGVQAHNRLITIETTLINPPAGSNNFEQGGLYFGLDEDNYVKLVVMATSSGRAIIELLREVNAASVANTDNIRSSAITLSSSTVRLKMIINPENNTAEAFYKVNTGAEIRLGVLSVPANFINGITLGTQSNVSYAGVFATHRRATSSLVYVFDDFNITTPFAIPVAPSNFMATALSASEISLSWDNNAANVGNYILESTSDTTSGFSVLATLASNIHSYTHTGLGAGQGVYYRIKAINQAGSSVYSNTIYSVTSLPEDDGSSYRSVKSGNWNDHLIWEKYDRNTSSWKAAAVGKIPGSQNDVYLEEGLTVTLSGNAECNNLFLNIKEDVHRVNTQQNTLNVNGKISLYAGSIVTGLVTNPDLSLRNTNVNPPLQLIKADEPGRIKFVGKGREIIKAKEFSANLRLSGWTMEFALDEGAIGTIDESIRLGSLIVSSGILDVGNSHRLFGDRNGVRTDVNGKLIIKSGAVLQGGNGIFKSNEAAMESFHIEQGGKYINRFSTPTIATNNYSFDGLFGLVADFNQDFPKNDADGRSGRAGAVEINTFNDVLIGGSGLKRLQNDIYLYGTLEKQGTAEIDLNGFKIIYLSHTAPIAPTDLIASAGGTTSIILEWKDNADNETGYVIESLQDGSSWVVIANLPAGATRYTHKGLSAEAEMFYRVKAINKSGSSEYINISAKTLRPNPGTISHVPQYNGNISAVKWGVSGGESIRKEQIYAYHYDPSSRLIKSQYAVKNGTGYTDIGGFNENLRYDMNGNIQKLERNGLAPVATLIDDLDYFYSGNQLLKVGDQSNNFSGFKDGHKGNDNDYEYDKNGNMIKDRNKGINHIKYNHMNLPTEIQMDGNKMIRYIYDATGAKLSQQVYENGDMIKETQYLGEMIYEREGTGDLKLAVIQHEEGRLVPDAASPGNYEYQYHLKDHLGNVRITFTSKPKTHTFAVNYENSIAKPDDIALFEETENVINNDLFDKTDAGTTFKHSQRLTGHSSAKIGSVISIPVGAGDKISAEVFAKWVAASNTDNPAASLAPLLLAALTGTPTMTTVDGGATAITNSYGSGSLLTNSAYNYTIDANHPMAFINMLFIPERAQSSIDKSHFAFKQINGGKQELNTTTKAAHSLMQIDNFEAKEKGTIIIYLSNESSKLTEVYFDELKITLNEHPVIQGEDYYPFGLSFNEFRRSTNTFNPFLYNGKEWQDELNLGWYDYQARQYDPAIARWMVPDPLSGLSRRWSPYTYCYNNPLLFIDPDGMFADFYDEKGNKIGTDGKDDGKVIVVTNRSEAKSIKATDKAGGTTQVSEVKSGVQLPSAGVRAEMGKAVERSLAPNESVGDKTGGFHEEGGIFGLDANGQEKVIDAKPGQAATPGQDDYASVDVFSGETPNNALSIVEGTFHTHPNGTNGSASFDQNPSNFIDKATGERMGDIPTAQSQANPSSARHVTGNHYVLGTGDNKVRVYNGSGTVATFPLTKFTTIGIKK